MQKVNFSEAASSKKILTLIENEMRACKLKYSLESQHKLPQTLIILKRPLYHGRTIYQMLLYIPIHVWNQTGQNSEQFYFVFFVPEMTRHSNIVFICAFNSIIPHVSSDADMNHWVNLRTIVFFLEQGQTACQHLLAQHFLNFFGNVTHCSEIKFQRKELSEMVYAANI